jgi:hypothetical protein
MNTAQPDSYRQSGDPLADAAIGQLVAEKGPAEARELFSLLIHRIEMPIEELPACLQDYWATTDRLPDWVDWEQVRIANALFVDHGPKFLVFLYYKSLPLLYSCANGAKVLIQTGRLTQQEDSLEIFTRRIAETGQFLLTVMAPDALRPCGPGIRAIQKVRLIHAAIRYFVLESGRWDAEAWGLPINQEDMAMTLTTFSSAITDALGQFDVPENPLRLEAYQHTWAAIGQLLGVVPDLLPKTTAASRTLMEAVLERQSAASDDGQVLTEALFGFARKLLPEELARIPELLLLHLIGPERAKMLGVESGGGCLGIVLPQFIGSLFRLGERLEDRVQEPLRVFIDMLSQKMMERMVLYFDNYKQRHFEVPAGLRKVWLE